MPDDQDNESVEWVWLFHNAPPDPSKALCYITDSIF